MTLEISYNSKSRGGIMKNKVKVEMHLYQGGGHGYGMNNKTTKDKWMERCFNWMEGNNWLENK